MINTICRGYFRSKSGKVCAVTAIMKAMGADGNGVSAFMEDHSYHLVEGKECSMGAHMLEARPFVAATGRASRHIIWASHE